MTEMKPCPFCGTVPKMVKRNNSVFSSYHFVIEHGPGQADYHCVLDYMTFGDYSTEEKAIRHWNTRVKE